MRGLVSLWICSNCIYNLHIFNGRVRCLNILKNSDVLLMKVFYLNWQHCNFTSLLCAYKVAVVAKFFYVAHSTVRLT